MPSRNGPFAPTIHPRIGLTSRPRWVLIALALLAIATGAAAQPATSAPAPATSATAASATLTPMERARRDADRVFYWVKLHANLPAGHTAKPPLVKEPAAVAADRPARSATRRPAASTRVASAAAAAAAPGSAAPGAALSGAPDRGAPAALTAASDEAAGDTAPVAQNAAANPAATPAATDTESTKAIPAEAPAQAEGHAVADPPASSDKRPAERPTELVAQAAPPDDVNLQPIVQPMPEYPPGLVENLRRGSVRLQFDVLPDGSIGGTEVLTSSDAQLNPAALAAVQKWRFKPVARLQPARVDLVFNLD